VCALLDESLPLRKNPSSSTLRALCA